MPAAQPGIYTYKVTAVHDAFPMCQNVDKSGVLTPTVEDFRYWLLPTEDPSVKTMTGYVQYKLNRAAGAAHIDIYGRDLAGGYPELRQGNIACPDLSAGIHLADTFSFDVSVDENGELLGTYHAVIYATETTEDGELNRDLLPKFAMQRNDEDDPVTLDLSVADRVEATEEQPGGYLCVNLGDDDANSQEDRTQTTPPAGIAGEDDLLGLTLGLPDAAVNVGVVTLTATAGGGKLGDCVWLSATKAPVGVVHSWALGGPDTTWDLSVPQRPSQTQLWLEGIERSGGPRDITLELSYTAGGAAPLVDRVNLTVFEVTTLTPQGDPTKILIRSFDGFPCPNQIADGTVSISATVEPAEEGVLVIFRTFDPDDQSQYEWDPGGDDNRDYNPDPQNGYDNRLGNLLLPGGGTPTGGSTRTYGNGQYYQIGVTTDQNGAAAAQLTITGRFAGDNYYVAANPCTGTDGGDRHTADLVAWKRIYIEKDRMYTRSVDLTADLHRDQDTDPDTLEVQSTAEFVVNQAVVVFDCDGYEDATVLAKPDATHLIVTDLQSDYGAGYGNDPDWSCGAAVTHQDMPCFDVDFLGRLKAGYGDHAAGTDGGCFVEYVQFEFVQKTAYRRFFPDSASMQDYSRVWFHNYSSNANCIHAIAAGYGASETDQDVASSNAATAHTFAFRLLIDYWDQNGLPMLDSDIVAHEFGHHFGLNDGCPNPCHSGIEDLCLMSQDRNRADEISEFCGPTLGQPDAGHVYVIRGREDPI